MAVLRLGEKFPSLTVNTTEGQLDLLKWKGEKSWAVLFSHPRDFTPVCTTELAKVATLAPEFAKRDVKLIGLSCDSIDDHKAWQKDILCYSGCKDIANTKFPYPMIEDKDRKIAKTLGMVDKDESESVGMPLTCRGVFIIGPDDKLKMFMFYPATTGRDFTEILRVVDSLQLTFKHGVVATPAGWKQGQDVMITPAANQEQAKAIDPNFKILDVPSKKPYLKVGKQPKA